MKHQLKNVCAVSAFMLLGGLLSACGSGDSPNTVAEDCVPAHPGIKTLEEGTLKVGIADYPPIVSPTGPKGYSGLDADIIDGFAAAECLTVEPIDGSAAIMIQGVQQKRWDTALGGWYRSADRETKVTMGYPMYLDQMIIVADTKISTFEELKEKKIGIITGYTFAGDLKKFLGDSLTTYSDVNLEINDLKVGRIDALIDVASITSRFVKEGLTVTVAQPDDRVPTSVEPAQTSLPFAKSSDPSLREAFNDYIKKAHENGDIAKFLAEHGLDPSLAETGEPRFL